MREKKLFYEIRETQDEIIIQYRYWVFPFLICMIALLFAINNFLFYILILSIFLIFYIIGTHRPRRMIREAKKEGRLLNPVGTLGDVILDNKTDEELYIRISKKK